MAAEVSRSRAKTGLDGMEAVLLARNRGGYFIYINIVSI
jgi:hypothetical protein